MHHLVASFTETIILVTQRVEFLTLLQCDCLRYAYYIGPKGCHRRGDHSDHLNALIREEQVPARWNVLGISGQEGLE